MNANGPRRHFSRAVSLESLARLSLKGESPVDASAKQQWLFSLGQGCRPRPRVRAEDGRASTRTHGSNLMTVGDRSRVALAGEAPGVSIPWAVCPICINNGE